MKDGSRRILFIDHLRIFAMFCVILIHTCKTAITDFPLSSASSYGGVLFYCIRNICRFSVPIFFMITGALFLDPQKNVSIEKLLKYIKKYLLVILFFGWGFALAELLFTERIFQIQILYKSFLNMFSGKSWEHMWYLYELVGIMCVIPIMRALVRAIDELWRNYMIIILFFFLSIVPFFEEITGFSLGIRFPINSVHFMYVFLGYWLCKDNISLGIKQVAIIAVLYLILNYIDARLYFSEVDISLTRYNSPVIVVGSMAVFWVFKMNYQNAIMNNKVTTKIIMFISKCSFGVYIIHMLWINLIYKYFHFNPFNGSVILNLVLVYFTVSLLSIGTSYLMNKIPLIKKIIS